MMDEINRINQVLPTSLNQKTSEIQRWMGSVTQQLNHLTSEHHKILKEAATLLELALWKANLDHNEGQGDRRDMYHREWLHQNMDVTL